MEKINLNKYLLFRLKGTKDWYCMSPEVGDHVNQLALEHDCTVFNLSSVPEGHLITAYPVSGDKKFVYSHDSREVDVSRIEFTL